MMEKMVHSQEKGGHFSHFFRRCFWVLRQGSVSVETGKTERERREQARFQTEIRPDITGPVDQRGKSEKADNCFAAEEEE